MSNNRRMSLDESEQESSEPEDIESPTESQSPRMRRSSRVRQRQQQPVQNTVSDSDSEDEDDTASNRNNSHNHNRNRRVASDDDDDDEDGEEKNITEPPAIVDDDDDDGDDEDADSKDDMDELSRNPFADFSVTLPTHISRLNPRYNKLDDDIHDVALQSVIDTAASLAEYNHECKDYEQQAQRLKTAMHRLLNVSRDLKIEQLMLGRIADGIRDEKLSEVSGIDLSEDAQNPLKNGAWTAFFDEYRSNVVQEIEAGQAKDSEAVTIKQFVRNKTAEYEQQFNEATTVDPIQEADENHNRGVAGATETQGGEQENNGDGDGGEDDEDDDDDDDDIVIDASSKNVNVGSIKCPLTQQIFKHPIKSKQCGHTFEREAIQQYIGDKKRAQELTECPLPGCNTILIEEQFVRDIRVEKMMKKQRKTQQDQDSDEEDDEAFDLTVRPSL